MRPVQIRLLQAQSIRKYERKYGKDEMNAMVLSMGK